MGSSEMTAGPLPADQGADAPVPAGPQEARPGSQRKLIVLLVMLLVFLMLSLVASWYLLFHKPITEILPGVTAPEALPTYQGSLYNLSRPNAVAVSGDATRLVITQLGTTYDTVMFDRQGNKLAVLAPPSDQVPTPHQMFVATDPLTGEYWTTDRFNSIVAIYSSAGKFEKIFDPGADLQSWQPLGIAFDKAGDAFIVDVGDGPAVIHVFGPDGKQVRSFGKGLGLNNPNGLAVASDGKVYVADSGNGQLKVFDTSGAVIGAIDRGATDGNFGLPVGVAIDDHGNVLVVDSSSSRVQAYKQLTSGQTSPDYINAFGDKGTGDAQLSFPNGLAADSQGRVYVADWGNDRLEIWGY
jgi:DNA-binding beta-propeller fold protein YncE